MEGVPLRFSLLEACRNRSSLSEKYSFIRCPSLQRISHSNSQQTCTFSFSSLYPLFLGSETVHPTPPSQTMSHSSFYQILQGPSGQGGLIIILKYSKQPTMLPQGLAMHYEGASFGQDSSHAVFPLFFDCFSKCHFLANIHFPDLQSSPEINHHEAFTKIFAGQYFMLFFHYFRCNSSQHFAQVPFVFKKQYFLLTNPSVDSDQL